MNTDKSHVTIKIVRGGKIEEQTIDANAPWSGWVPTTAIRVPDEQLRAYFSQQEAGLLRGSLDEVGQIEPATAILYKAPDNKNIEWLLNTGARRLLSDMQKGVLGFWIAYKPGVKESDIFSNSMVSNLCKADHSNIVIARGIDRLIEQYKLSLAQVALRLGRPEDWVEERHSLLMLTNRLQALLDFSTPEEKRIPYAVALKLAKLESGEQERVWDLIKHLPKGKMLAKIRELAAQGKIDRRGLGGQPLSAEQIVSNGIAKVVKQFQPILELTAELWKELKPSEARKLLLQLKAFKGKVASIEEILRPITKQELEPAEAEQEEPEEAATADPEPAHRLKEPEPETESETEPEPTTGHEEVIHRIPEPQPKLVPVFGGAPRAMTSDDVLRQLRERPRPPQKPVPKPKPPPEPEFGKSFTDADFPDRWPSDRHRW